MGLLKNKQGRIQCQNVANIEKRYNKIRKLVYQTAKQSFREAGNKNIRASSISPEALTACKAWINAPDRHVDWDWFTQYTEFKSLHPKRFEISLWQSNQLIGLSMGKPSYSETELRLELVEAAPRSLGDRPEIMGMMLFAYGVYARMINATELRIMHPINDTVRKYYEKFGYTFVSSGSYLYRKIV